MSLCSPKRPEKLLSPTMGGKGKGGRAWTNKITQTGQWGWAWQVWKARPLQSWGAEWGGACLSHGSTGVPFCSSSPGFVSMQWTVPRGWSSSPIVSSRPCAHTVPGTNVWVRTTSLLITLIFVVVLPRPGHLGWMNYPIEHLCWIWLTPLPGTSIFLCEMWLVSHRGMAQP